MRLKFFVHFNIFQEPPNGLWSIFKCPKKKLQEPKDYPSSLYTRRRMDKILESKIRLNCPRLHLKLIGKQILILKCDLTFPNKWLDQNHLITNFRILHITHPCVMALFSKRLNRFTHRPELPDLWYISKTALWNHSCFFDIPIRF